MFLFFYNVSLNRNFKLSIYIHFAALSIISVINVWYLKWNNTLSKNSKLHNTCQKCWFVNTFNNSNSMYFTRFSRPSSYMHWIVGSCGKFIFAIILFIILLSSCVCEYLMSIYINFYIQSFRGNGEWNIKCQSQFLLFSYDMELIWNEIRSKRDK